MPLDRGIFLPPVLWTKTVVLIIIIIVQIAGFVFANYDAYEASLPYRQEAIDAIDLDCGAEVQVSEGQKYLFDSKSAIEYETRLYAAEAAEKYNYEGNRRKRSTDQIEVSEVLPEEEKKVVDKINAGFQNKIMNFNPHLDFGLRQNHPFSVHSTKTVKETRMELHNVAKNVDNAGNLSENGQQIETPSEDVKSDPEQEKTSSVSGRGAHSRRGGHHGYAHHRGGHNSRGSKYYFGHGAGGGYKPHRGGSAYSGYRRLGGHSDSGYSSQSTGSHSSYSGDDDDDDEEKEGEGYSYKPGGAGYGHAYYAYNYPANPPICEWTFIAGETCQLESHIIKFRKGVLDCHKQQFVISDNYTDFTLCGYQKLYPGFRAETPVLTIKYWKKPYTYRHVFKGYVTCVGRAQRPTFNYSEPAEPSEPTEPTEPTEASKVHKVKGQSVVGSLLASPHFAHATHTHSTKTGEANSADASQQHNASPNSSPVDSATEPEITILAPDPVVTTPDNHQQQSITEHNTQEETKSEGSPQVVHEAHAMSSHQLQEMIAEMKNIQAIKAIQHQGEVLAHQHETTSNTQEQHQQTSHNQDSGVSTHDHVSQSADMMSMAKQLLNQMRTHTAKESESTTTNEQSEQNSVHGAREVVEKQTFQMTFRESPNGEDTMDITMDDIETITTEEENVDTKSPSTSSDSITNDFSSAKSLLMLLQSMMPQSQDQGLTGAVGRSHEEEQSKPKPTPTRQMSPGLQASYGETPAYSTVPQSYGPVPYVAPMPGPGYMNYPIQSRSSFMGYPAPVDPNPQTVLGYQQNYMIGQGQPTGMMTIPVMHG